MTTTPDRPAPPDDRASAHAVQQLTEHDPAQIGPYRLLGLLGGGGMGQVYLAAGGSRLIAVKVVHPGLAHDRQFRVRFAREVEAGRRLRGPGIAAVVDADPEAPLPWLATEYVRGVPLDHAVRLGGPLPLAAVRLLAAGLAHALALVHAAGLVHRDVKPPNVLLAADRPYLIDFGIAQALDDTQLSATGAVIGTPTFMSPEQAQGFPAGTESDVFSLGAVLAYAGLGRGPFGDADPMVLLRRIVDDPPDLRGLDGPLGRLVAACLAKQPADRPAAADLGASLEPARDVPGPGWLPTPVAALVPPTPDVPALRAAADTVVRAGQDTVLGSATPAFASTVMPIGRHPVRRRALLAGAAAAVGLTAVGGLATLLPRMSRAAPTAAAPAAPVAAPAPPSPGAATLLWTAPGPPHPTVIRVAGDTVYVGGSGIVAALDRRSGAERWRHEEPDPGDNIPWEWVDIAVADGTVAVTTRGVTNAFDEDTGRRRWRAETGSGGGIRVAVGRGTVFTAVDELVALDAATGDRRWSRALARAAYAPTIDGDQVLVSSNVSVEALDAATGAVRWTRAEEGGPIALSASDGTVFLAPALGNVVALDSTTGAERWVEGIGEGGAAPSRPALVDGSVVVLGRDEQLHALATDSGQPRWTAAVPGSGSTGGKLSATGAFAADPTAGLVCSGSTSHGVYALDSGSGETRWVHSWSADDNPLQALAASDGTVFAVADGRVLALGPA
jgi:outer membrane protein assembly factor BamB